VVQKLADMDDGTYDEEVEHRLQALRDAHTEHTQYLDRSLELLRFKRLLRQSLEELPAPEQ
jgi:hypothetical protein